MPLNPADLRQQATSLRKLANQLEASARLCETVSRDTILMNVLGASPVLPPRRPQAVKPGTIRDRITRVLHEAGGPLQVIEIRRRIAAVHGPESAKEDSISKCLMIHRRNYFIRESRGIWGLREPASLSVPEFAAASKIARQTVGRGKVKKSRSKAKRSARSRK